MWLMLVAVHLWFVIAVKCRMFGDCRVSDQCRYYVWFLMHRYKHDSNTGTAGVD